MTCIFKPFCVCVYIYKKEQAFFFPLSIHGILLGPTAAPPERGEKRARMAGSPLSLQLLRLFLAALSAMHAAFLTSLQSQSSAGVLYVVEPYALIVRNRFTLPKGREDMGSWSTLSCPSSSSSCMSRKEGIGRKTAWQAAVVVVHRASHRIELIKIGSTAGQSCAGHVREERRCCPPPDPWGGRAAGDGGIADPLFCPRLSD